MLRNTEVQTLTAQSLSSAMSSTAEGCACQLANLLSHTHRFEKLYNMLYKHKSDDAKDR
jgi:hypothetical protein